MKVTLIRRSTRLRAPRYGALTDEEIDDAVREALRPHRCAVQFETDAFDGTRRIALQIKVVTIKGKTVDKEYVVGDVRLDGLRRVDALKQYLADVRTHLRNRGVVFTSPLTSTGAMSMNDVRRRGYAPPPQAPEQLGPAAARFHRYSPR